MDDDPEDADFAFRSNMTFLEDVELPCRFAEHEAAERARALVAEVKRRKDLQAEAERRNAEGAARPGPYQHWYVTDGLYRPTLTCEWRRVPLEDRVRRWLVEQLGGEYHW